MNADLETLKSYAASYKLELSSGMLQKFQVYGEQLQEWNQKMNLTAIVDDDGILIKHFLDSLLLLDAIHVPMGAKLIDVGTGAGFPGVPVKIARPDTELTLLDSLNKRITFLKALCDALEMQASCIHGRAEDLGKKGEFRELYDISTARAVTELRELAEYCLPFVKIGGYFAALKGYDVEDELKGSEKAVRLMGGKVQEVKKYVLPDGSKRSIVCIEKISQTPAKYPRPFSKMAKTPLK